MAPRLVVAWWTGGCARGIRPRAGGISRLGGALSKLPRV